MNTLQEKILIFRLQKGDKEAFGKIYDFYIERIYRFIYFKVNSQERAEDLTSECFLKIFEYLQNTDQEVKSLQALIYKTARNLIIDYYRSKENQNLSLDENIQIISTDYSSQEKLEIAIEQKNILKALEKLTNKEWQEIIILKYIEGYSHKEIAQIINKKSGAVRTALSRALNELKKHLTKNNNER